MDSRPLSRRNWLLPALAAFGAGAGLALWLLRREPPTAGYEAVGVSVYLEQGGAPISDTALADAVLADARQSLIDRPLSAELHDAVAASLSEALRRAAAQGAPSSHGAALARLQPEQVQWVWEDNAWDARVLLGGREVAMDSLSAKDPPADMRDDSLVHVRVALQLAPWPRTEREFPHPEILLVQARADYFTPDFALAAFGRALADEVALRAAARVRLAAEARGLTGRVRPPQP